MQSLSQVLQETINETLTRVIISNPRQKGEDCILKIKIRVVGLAEGIRYQVTEYIGAQVFHKNLTNTEAMEYVNDMVTNHFKQCEIVSADKTVTILVSKKGAMNIRARRNSLAQIQATDDVKMHNRTKNYLLQEGVPVPFLVDLGVMTKEGEVCKTRYDKFKQINRFLEFVKDILPALPKDREISIIDFGCGKSYLTFAIYYYLHELQGLSVSITGLDLKKSVIKHCNELAQKYGYDKLVFKLGDIADYTEQDQVDMVVTLHACDTATDYALYKAVTWGARVILSVPCCQHELNKQMDNPQMEPLLRYGILKERMAALMTDAIRGETLRIMGYKTDILEFIDMEHTPKNLLIRAVRGQEKGNKDALMKMVKEYNVEPSIISLFSSKLGELPVE